MKNRILMTTTLLSLLSAFAAACTASGDGDGSGGSEATATSSASGGTGGEDGTGGDDGAGGGDTTTAGSGGGAGTGGSDAEGGYCALSCETAADCCPAGAQGCPGDYPYNYECVDNLCENSGCSEDAQCQFDGLQPDYGCFRIDGVGGAEYGLCSEGCETDDDCETDGWVCIGESPDGAYCLPEPVDPAPCDDDNDCRGFGVCQDDGTCRCGADDECTEDGYVCIE